MNADMYVPCVVALEQKAQKLGAEIIEEFDEDFKILKDQIKVQCDLPNVEHVFLSLQQIQPFNFF